MLKKIKRALRIGGVEPLQGNTIVINAEKLERRVALLEDGILEEYDVEREGDNNIVGCVFKGRVKNIEQGLKAFSACKKINYLMLMMVDKEVHYHVLPRYSETRNFEGVDYLDPGWPAVPDLTSGPVLEGESLAAMVAGIRGCWPD